MTTAIDPMTNISKQIPKQKLSKADWKKVNSIILNMQNGNVQQATQEFDAFTRDKKMDKVRSIGLGTLTAVTIISTAILTHKACPNVIKKIGDAFAFGAKNFVKNHEKIYNSVQKHFPKITEELQGKIGNQFATRALESTNVLKRVANKLAFGNTEVGKSMVEGLAKRNINNLGDIIGIGVAAIGALPASSIVSDIGNILDEYGDGDRGKNEMPTILPNVEEATDFEEEIA